MAIALMCCGQALAQTPPATPDAAVEQTLKDAEQKLKEAQKQLREAQREAANAQRKAAEAKRKAAEAQRKANAVKPPTPPKISEDKINMTIEKDGETFNWSFDTKQFEQSMERVGKVFERSFEGFDKNFEHIGEDMGQMGEKLGRAFERGAVELEKSLEEGNSNRYYSGSARNWGANDVSKKRVVSYKSNGQNFDKLSVNNKYGKVHINTWDKNEIVVDAEIIAHASTEANAQKLLQGIDVQQSSKDKTLLMNTVITKANSNRDNSYKGMEINYVISMPKQIALQVVNKFGDVYLADFKGNTDINVSYGSAKFGQLLGAENQLKVSFGSATAEYIKQGNLDFSYSTLNLESGDKLDFKTDFSTLNVEKVQSFGLNSRYDNIEVENVNAMKGNAKFSKINIGKLTERLEVNAQYCDVFEVEEVAKGFKNIDLDGKFGSFELNFDEGSSFDFDTDFKFGDLRVDKDVMKINVSERRNQNNSYKGSFGKSPNSTVKISSQYGDARMRVK